MESQHATNDHPFYNRRRYFIANMVDMGNVVRERERNLLNNLLPFFGL
jgi:hypothetical protein